MHDAWLMILDQTPYIFAHCSFPMFREKVSNQQNKLANIKKVLSYVNFITFAFMMLVGHTND